MVETGIRRLAAGWMLLALLALALSTACALLLVAGRVPLPGGALASIAWFRSALVLHVGLAVVVWFLSCAAALWTLAAGGRAGRVRWTALALAGGGMLAMIAALFADGGAPVLSNYIPVLHGPVFLLGLGWFLAGVALCALTSVPPLWTRLRAAAGADADVDASRLTALLSIAVTLVALALLLIPLASDGMPGDAARFEMVSWGPGHVLQFAHVILLMSVWAVLGEQVLGRPAASRRFLNGLLLLAALPVLAAPGIYLAHPMESVEFRHAFTRLMAWTSWPAAALLGLRLLPPLLRARAAGRAPLLLSILLFLLGCAFGAAIRGESTMVPAHYHGTVGAVTLAYMALGYRLLPAFGFALQDSRLLRWQPAVYGAGLLALAAALAWSGWMGVPRKTLHVDVIVQYPAYFIAMALVGVGGTLAVSGAALFVFNVIRILRAGRAAAGPADPGFAWRGAMASSVAALAASAALFAFLPGIAPVSASNDPAAHAAAMRQKEIARRFAEAVALLNAKEYQAAAGALHGVLALAPKLPEANVNMGFALIGLQDFTMARSFFEAAIDLRTSQVNAYYGLALALEGLGDLPGALGAMRTYVHRSKAAEDDPYLRKANAAIWEWEDRIERTRIAAIPESGNGEVRYPIIGKRLR